MLATVFLTSMLPSDNAEPGIFSLVPAIFLIIYIFATQRILEALILASLIGFIMVSRPAVQSGESWIANTFSNFSDGLLNVMMSEDIAWLIIVCGLMGSIISLIEKAGGSYAFGEWIAAKAKTEKIIADVYMVSRRSGLYRRLPQFPHRRIMYDYSDG